MDDDTYDDDYYEEYEQYDLNDIDLNSRRRGLFLFCFSAICVQGYIATTQHWMRRIAVPI